MWMVHKRLRIAVDVQEMGCDFYAFRAISCMVQRVLVCCMGGELLAAMLLTKLVAT